MNSIPHPTQNNQQKTSLELIHALNAIALALQASIQNEENVYRIFQEQVTALGLRGGISELDEEKKTLNFKTVAFTNPLRKLLSRFEKKSKLHAKGYSIPYGKVDVYQKVVKDGSSLFVKDTSTVSNQVVPEQLKGLVKPLLAILGSPPGIFTPLIYNGKIMGMLNMVGPKLTEEDVPTMQVFANQIAVSLENTRLVSKLQCVNNELESAYQKTLEGWVQALDLKDNTTEGHTLRTAEHTVKLARFIGVPECDLPHVRRGALLHDMGKMAIPDNILNKPGPLSEEEWVIMKQHPQTAYFWLSSIEYLKPALEIPLYHHEWWNGKGYPLGLQGHAIPYWARIFSIIDVWDAMRSDRPYRHALPEREISIYIRGESGKKFDPEIVEAFFAWRKAEAFTM